MYNVLLVDDEPRSRQALEDNVDWRKCGVRIVEQASSMKEAVNIIRKGKTSILICDIEMPNGSGLDLVKWVKENNHQMSIIFVTCHPEFDYMRKAIQLKCYDYILKPIDYEEFSHVLVELIQKMETMEYQGMDKNKLSDSKSISEKIIAEYEKNYQERNIELEVKQYVKEHLMDDIVIADIAGSMHFNPQYLMRTFKNKTGSSIMEYITNTRIEAAKKILEGSNIPIKEVSSMVGYRDYAYFTRVFKKECGCSPSQYRNER